MTLYQRSHHIYMPVRDARKRALWWQNEALYSPSWNDVAQEIAVFRLLRPFIIMLNYTPMVSIADGSV